MTMRLDDRDIVAHLRSNLERYGGSEDGTFGNDDSIVFVIAKELLQNADDAEACSVSFTVREGWPGATSPLLQGPGLLLVNNGKYTKEAGKGMRRYGGSLKTADGNSIGRFGLGQKAVFHLCDAFVVVAKGYAAESETFTINPYDTIARPGDGSELWRDVAAEDADRIAEGTRVALPGDRQLALWFPLRREGLRPKPESPGIVDRRFQQQDLTRGLGDLTHLASVFAMLRHVTRIAIGEGPSAIVLDRGKTSAPKGPGGPLGDAAFGGSLGGGALLSGRERVSEDAVFKDIWNEEHWPRTYDRDADRMVRQKGKPHGAVAVIHLPDGSPGIDLSWSVFLPVGEPEELASAGARRGRTRVVLHGYFFVDSGRRRILFDAASAIGGEAGTTRRWNEAVRDRLVLPLLPSALADAAGHLGPERAEAIVSALRASKLFSEHRSAVCSEHQLVRRATGQREWATVAAGTPLRPLPPGFEARDLRAFMGAALGSEVELCAPEGLCAADPHWPDAELAQAIEADGANLFRSAPNLRLAAALLGNAPRGSRVASALVASLRAALASDARLAERGAMPPVLSHVPADRLLGVGKDTQRTILAAVAATGASVLCVPSDILPSQAAPRAPFVLDEDVTALLRPLVDASQAGGQAGADAGAVAIRVLEHAKSSPGALARLADLRHVPVFPAGAAPISLHELASRATGGALFERIGDLSLLKAFGDAVPNVDAAVVEQGLAKVLRDRSEGASDPIPARLDATGVAKLIERHRGAFAGPAQRRALVETLLKDSDGHGVVAAVRRLACGDPELSAGATLVDLPPEMDGLEGRLVRAAQATADWRIVPRLIAEVLNGKHKRMLAIEAADSRALVALLGPETLRPPLDAAEYAALLSTPLADSDLCTLPVHPHAGGERRVIDDQSVLSSQMSRVPPTLRASVREVRLFDRPARNRLERLVPKWTAARQLWIALGEEAPARHWKAILDALESLPEGERDVDGLRAKEWLPTAAGAACAPSDVLDLGEATVQEARRLLPGRALPLVGDIAAEVREHPGFGAARPCFNSRSDSLSLLAEMVSDAKLAGRQGDWEAEDVPYLRVLARAGVERPVAGWALLRAVLQDSAEDKDVKDLFEALGKTDEAGYVDDMNALAKLGAETGEAAEAARRLHRRWFGRAARQAFLPPDLLVPTRDDGWREAKETVGRQAGVAQAHMIADNYAEVLPQGGVDVRNAARRGDDFTRTRPSEIVAKSLAAHQEVLERWRGCVPPDLVLLYLRLVGDRDEFASFVDGWSAKSAAGGRAAWWNDIERRLDGAIAREHADALPFSTAVRERFVYAIRGAAGRVGTLSLAGAWSDFPAGTDGDLLRGNRHAQRIERDGLVFHVAELSPEDPPADPERAREVFAHLIREVAAHVHGLQGNARRELDGLIAKALNTTQTTLDSTEAQIVDRLPQIIDEMKPDPAGALGRAHAQYRADEQKVRHDPSAWSKAKGDLWRWLRDDGAVAAELLAAVRRSIAEMGYDPCSVLFELFQNADDAYAQLGEEDDPGEPVFRVERSEGALRVAHRGRPVNDRGRDAALGESRGYDRDLLHMLIKNLSDKRGESGVTGRFGLGFKSVHLLAREVRIASHMIAVTVRGGLLPVPWAGAPAEARAGATLIELDLDPTRLEMAEQAVAAFTAALPWLAATGKRIRGIGMPGGGIVRVTGSHAVAAGVDLIELGTARALRLDLGGGFAMTVELHAGAPVPLGKSIRGLWCLAPLGDRIGGGWLINGPWRIDPGRNHVHDPAAALAGLGLSLRDRLIALHDALADDATAETVFGATPGESGRQRFWKGMQAVFAGDGDAARALHENEGGWTGAAGQRAVVPTGLPEPFGGLVMAGPRLREASGALGHERVLGAACEWPTVKAMVGQLVSGGTASDLAALGFKRPAPFTLAEVLRDELRRISHNVGVEDARRLGRVLSLARLNDAEFTMEARQLRREAKEARFPSWKTEYRQADALVKAGESVLDGLVPDGDRLASGFETDEAAAAFFDLARADKGFDANAPYRLSRWIGGAGTRKEQEAVLHALRDNDARRFVERALMEPSGSWPGWLPKDERAMRRLLEGWSWDRVSASEVVAVLFGMRTALETYAVQEAPSADADGSEPVASLADELTGLHEWWRAEGKQEAAREDKLAYPKSFDPKALPREADDLDAEGRVSWFTMLALARLQGMGRTQPGQHRTYIEQAIRAGWWGALASDPTGNPESWIARLRAWSEPSIGKEEYGHWNACLVDFYRIARWLPAYAAVILVLPRALETRRDLRDFDAILDPSSSRVWGRMGLDAAGLRRPLGAGLPWLLRELSRHGIFGAHERAIAPYAWSPTARARKWLADRGCAIGEDGGPDRSLDIHEAMADALGGERALFDGDHDLPLQIAADEGRNADYLRWRRSPNLAAAE